MSTGLTLIGSVTLSINHGLLPYSILLVVIGFGSGMTQPVMFAMAGSVWPEGGRRAFNAIYVARNFGVALGASLAGYVADISFDYVFIANASLFAVFFMIVLLTFRPMESERNRRMSTSVLEQYDQVKSKSAFTGLLILSAGFLVAWLVYSQWQSTIASHTQDLGIPLNQYSLIWAINGALIVAGQPLVKLLVDRVTSLKTHIYLGAGIFLMSFIVASFAEDFSMFAVSMVILTFGEMLIWPAVPSLANNLAPKGRTGFYQGFVNSVAAAGRMTGPLVGGLIVDLYDIHVLFFVLFGLLIIPFVTTKLFDRGMERDVSSSGNNAEQN